MAQTSKIPSNGNAIMDHIHKNLQAAIYLTAAIFVIELLGGLIANSLALLSDSAHVFTDAIALVLSYGALKISARPSSREMTFGYHRFEIFAALINGLTIIGIALLIFYEAYSRILSPPAVRGAQVLVVAILGLIVNSWVALRLHGFHDINIRGAYLHVLGDALASLAVIIGAVVIIFTGRTIVDPVLSILIGFLLVYSAGQLIFGSVRILLEFAPEHVDADTLKEVIMQVEGVRGVHDIHIWSICSHIHAMSAHILVDRIHVQQTEVMIDKISRIVEEDFRILHTTLQFECEECRPVELRHGDYLHEHSH